MDLKKLTTLTGWQKFFRLLNKKEKISFFIFLIFFLSSLFFLLTDLYLKNTKIVPREGGEYIEGLLGSPRFINPIYAPLSDVDRDLTELVFSGLMKYNAKGELQPDLVKEYKILEGGRVYEFFLKENLFWSDHHPLTVDDVIFTVETIQNPEIKSPLRSNWLGVEMEKISDQALVFKLKTPSAVFLENCTLKIIPKHLWKNIPAQNFPFSLYNLNPIGSGPYKLEKISQDKEGKITSIELVRNPLYYGKKPYIEKISFHFFDSKEKLITAYKLKAIQGLSLNHIQDISNLGIEGKLHLFSLPRYFALFFNPKNSKLLAEKEVRWALNYGVDKNQILNEVFGGYGKIVNSPLLPEVYGLEEPEKTFSFDLEKAKEILEKVGFSDKDGDGFREKVIKKEPAFQFKKNLSLGSKDKEVIELQKCLAKDPEIYPEKEITGYFGPKTKMAVIRFQEKYKEDILKPLELEKGTGEVKERTREKLNEICFENGEEKISLSFSLTTVDQPMMERVAEILKNQWQKLGVNLQVKTVDINTLEKEILRKRNYESLLFGEVLGKIPDPFPFWHSSQNTEIGLNLANYENKNVDQILEKIRESLDEKERKENLEEFQNLILEDAPAVFLYSPDFLYYLSSEIKGIEEGIIVDFSKRFNNIENWYIKTKRVLK